MMTMADSHRSTRAIPSFAAFALLAGCGAEVVEPVDLLRVELTVAPAHVRISADQDELGEVLTCALVFRLAVSGGTVELGHVAEFTYRTDHRLQQHTTLGHVFGETARAGQIRTITVRRTFWGPYEMRLQLPWRLSGDDTVRQAEAITRCE